ETSQPSLATALDYWSAAAAVGSRTPLFRSREGCFAAWVWSSKQDAPAHEPFPSQQSCSKKLSDTGKGLSPEFVFSPYHGSQFACRPSAIGLSVALLVKLRFFFFRAFVNFHGKCFR